MVYDILVLILDRPAPQGGFSPVPGDGMIRGRHVRSLGLEGLES